MIPSSDSRALFTGQAAATIFKTTGPWSTNYSWSDILGAVLPLFPLTGESPFLLIASLIHNAVEVAAGRFIKNAAITEKEYALEEHLATVFSSSRPNHRSKKIPTPSAAEPEAVKSHASWINGELLQAWSNLMENHIIFIAPFVQYGFSFERRKRVRGSGSYCLGLAPPNTGPGDCVLLKYDLEMENNRQFWMTPILKTLQRPVQDRSKGEKLSTTIQSIFRTEQKPGPAYSIAETLPAEILNRVREYESNADILKRIKGLNWEWEFDEKKVCRLHGVALNCIYGHDYWETRNESGIGWRHDEKLFSNVEQDFIIL